MSARAAGTASSGDGPPPRITRRRTATRAQLLDAAAEAFAESGTTNVSVESICTRAGYTRGAFYSNFASVDDLFFALYAHRSSTVLAHLEHLLAGPAAADPADQPESAHVVVHRVLEALPVEREWFLLRAVVMAQAHHHTAIATTLREHGDRFQQALQPALVALVGRLGRRLLVDPETFTQAVIAAHVGVVSQAVLYDDFAEVREATVRGVLLGLSASARVPGAPG